MERKTKPTDAEKSEPVFRHIKPRWKKISRGTLYPFPNQRNRRVKPNEVIDATEDEISKYRSDFELVRDGTGPYKIKSTAPVPKPKYVAKVQKDVYNLIPIGEGLYNVESTGGKVMNDHPLKRDEAEALQKSFDAETVED